MIALTLLPLYIHVNKQLAQVNRDLAALHLLYETVHAYLLEGTKENREGVERNGYFYDIYWSERDGEPPEVCVIYENTFGGTARQCETVEQLRFYDGGNAVVFVPVLSVGVSFSSLCDHDSPSRACEGTYPTYGMGVVPQPAEKGSARL